MEGTMKLMRRGKLKMGVNVAPMDTLSLRYTGPDTKFREEEVASYPIERAGYYDAYAIVRPDSREEDILQCKDGLGAFFLEAKAGFTEYSWWEDPNHPDYWRWEKILDAVSEDMEPGYGELYLTEEMELNTLPVKLRKKIRKILTFK